MRLDFTGERLLAVVAHPDDAELLCAGTLARALGDGAAIGLLVLCDGSKGQPRAPIPNLADVRRAEAIAAADVLGASILFGEVADGELFDTPGTRAIVVAAYRQFEPTLVLAHAANDYHADHRAASALAEAATWFAASPGFAVEGDAAPLAAAPALWWMDTIEGHDFEPHFFVDVTEHVATKQAMLRRHTSQLDRGGDTDFAPLETLMLTQCRHRGTQAGVPAAEAFRTHGTWKRRRAW
jgi:N-acetylglucosamine malate deacetylase 1